MAQQNELASLIWKIYEETGFLDYVGGMPGGLQRQANLHALYERAAEYEEMSFKGLFQFVRFINKMQTKNKDLSETCVVASDKSLSPGARTPMRHPPISSHPIFSMTPSVMLTTG